MVLLFINALIGGWLDISWIFAFDAGWLVRLFAPFLLFFVSISIFVSFSKQVSALQDYKLRYKAFKYNTAVFNVLLSAGKPVIAGVGNLGVRLGSATAKHTLLKVCNPYCDPCAKVHPQVETLLAECPDIALQVIFTASGELEDPKTTPVAHFLALQADYKSATVQDALHTWYQNPRKAYKDFASRFPLQSDPALQHENIRKMNAWCKSMKITHTPTFFLNGHQLPETYVLADLKYLLE
ncbi:DsbA family protein [Chitinophaga parva]